MHAKYPSLYTNQTNIERYIACSNQLIANYFSGISHYGASPYAVNPYAASPYAASPYAASPYAAHGAGFVSSHFGGYYGGPKVGYAAPAFGMLF